MFLTGEPETSVEVSQHELVLARLPDVMYGVGQLLLSYPGQFLPLHRRQRHVGDWVSGVQRGGLWTKKKKEKKGWSKKQVEQ